MVKSSTYVWGVFILLEQGSKFISLSMFNSIIRFVLCFCYWLLVIQYNIYKKALIKKKEYPYFRKLGEIIAN
jgi:hypothetical protein